MKEFIEMFIPMLGVGLLLLLLVYIGYLINEKTSGHNQKKFRKEISNRLLSILSQYMTIKELPIKSNRINLITFDDFNMIHIFSDIENKYEITNTLSEKEWLDLEKDIKELFADGEICDTTQLMIEKFNSDIKKSIKELKSLSEKGSNYAISGDDLESIDNAISELKNIINQ